MWQLWNDLPSTRMQLLVEVLSRLKHEHRRCGIDRHLVGILDMASGALSKSIFGQEIWGNEQSQAAPFGVISGGAISCFLAIVAVKRLRP